MTEKLPSQSRQTKVDNNHIRIFLAVEQILQANNPVHSSWYLLQIDHANFALRLQCGSE